MQTIQDSYQYDYSIFKVDGSNYRIEVYSFNPRTRYCETLAIRQFESREACAQFVREKFPFIK